MSESRIEDCWMGFHSSITFTVIVVLIINLVSDIDTFVEFD